jgi:hypothetical protein
MGASQQDGQMGALTIANRTKLIVIRAVERVEIEAMRRESIDTCAYPAHVSMRSLMFLEICITTGGHNET